MEKGKLFTTELLYHLFDDFLKVETTLLQILDLFKAAFGDSNTSPWRRVDGLENLSKVASCLKALFA